MEETLRNGDKIELIAKKVGELFGNEKRYSTKRLLSFMPLAPILCLK